MNIDLVTLFINLSESLPSVQAMVSGLGYIFGISLIISGLLKLQHASGGGREKVLSALTYFISGSLLVYLPTSIDTLSNTFFGTANILTYETQSEDPFYPAMKVMMETAGVIWFVRGCILLLRTGKPGVQDSRRCYFYIIAGILAMNIDNTINAVDFSLSTFVSLTSDGSSG